MVGVRATFFLQAEDSIRDIGVTGVQTCALPICGYVYVFDENLAFKNAWPIAQNINFIQGVGKDGKLIGRRDLGEGKHTNLCPAINGGMSWNSGTYSPKTGLYYKVGNEWCMDLEVVKTTPVTEPMAQLNIGANFTMTNPPGGKAYGHVDARDPITGQVAWRVDFPEPPLASLLSTGGDLLFVPDSRGIIHAYDTRSGTELWSHNNGLGHNGGIIRYSAEGKQNNTVAGGGGAPGRETYTRLLGGGWKRKTMKSRHAN